MPLVREYTEAFSLEPTDAILFDRLGIGTMYIEAENAFEGSYDIAMNYPATPPTGVAILEFVSVRAWLLPSPLDPVVPPQPAPPVSRAYAQTQPSGGSVAYTITQNGTGVGTVTFANGSQVGVIAIPVDALFAAGDVLAVVAPGNIFGMAGVAFTFAGLRQ